MRYFPLLAILFSFFLAESLLAAENSKPQKVVQRTEIELRDGSEVVGRLSKAQALVVNTSFGLATIALDQLQQIEVADDDETATLLFHSGDRLTVRLETPSFVVESTQGRLRIEYAQLKSLTAGRRVTPAMKPLKLVGVRASGAYQHLRPENAIDKDIDTFWNCGGWKGWLEVDLGEEMPLAEIKYAIQFWPAGDGTVEVYASSEPMGGERKTATLIKTFSGHMKNYDEFLIACPPKLSARYVQINCPQARSWFCIREIVVRRSQ